MASIKDKWATYKLEKANNKNKKILKKMGVTKEQKKSQVAMMSEPSKKATHENDNIDPKEEAVNGKLKKTINHLQDTYQSMKRKFDGLKKPLPSRVNKKMLKDAKSVINKYVDDYEDRTIRGLEKLEELSQEYGVTPLERFKPERNKELFNAMKSAARKTELTEETLRALFQKIFKDLDQPGEIANSFKDPFLAFWQQFAKILPPLKEMSQEISGDNYSLFKMRGLKKDIEKVVFKKFAIVDLTKLSNKQYRIECKERLGQFSERIGSLASDINTSGGQSKSQEKFMELFGACYKK